MLFINCERSIILKKTEKKDNNNVIQTNNNTDTKVNKKTMHNKEKNTKIKTKKKMNPFLKVFLIILISLLVVILSAIATIFIYFNNKLNKIEYSNLTKSDLDIDDKIDNELSDYRNIAILGIDARSDTFSPGNRSDCIMIVSVNKKTKLMLNVMPWFKNGSHDRIPTAMLNGAAVITDHSKYLDECFMTGDRSKERLFFYDISHPEKINSMVSDIFSDRDRLYKAALRGQKYA